MSSYTTRPIPVIAFKEIKLFFMMRNSWLILATVTMINGLAGWWAMHQQPMVNKALQMIFYVFSGTSMISCVLYGMRSIAEEKSKRTLEFLLTSPVNEYQIITGKFVALLATVMVQILFSLPIVAFAVVLGQGSWGHALAGYIGIIVLSAACLSVVIFYSSLTSSQVSAAALAGANIVVFLLLGFFSPYLSYPLKSVLRELSFYVRFSDFEKGAIVIRHIVFFTSVAVFYLYLSNLSLSSRHWRGR